LSFLFFTPIFFTILGKTLFLFAYWQSSSTTDYRGRMLRRLLVLLLAAAVHLAGAVGHALLQRRPAQLVLDAAEEIRFVERLDG
jgi:hypothetical protein